MPDVAIRHAVDADVPAITAIHNALLATTAIEWTEALHTVDERRDWLEKQQAARFPVLVATVGNEVVGWSTFGEFRDVTKWPGYRFTVEHTVHVRRDHWGAGVGRALMAQLVDAARSLDKHVMVAAVDGENEASIRFHQQLGFTEVARMPHVGAKFGRWLDLVLLQRELDTRPSPPSEA
jgi:phosphinothricin acetyltransferase